ncbi:EF-hand domain-containing protein [Brevundimonas sp.]|uniref:EF-hand domain-containing protein n=1 Tax=Brevundimonas sp. TaxID=1871086 RepID=UPI002BB18118|nr:EF-hand domain-containing protein [Brevundimonas sp.]HWQ85309.1 EF-hand domain-containing protein [Brevundimonas sp.]
MIRIAFASSAALVVLATASAAGAQTPPPGMGGGMGGPQTLEAMQARQDQMFDRLDVNTDGMITGDELAVLTRPPMSQAGGPRMRSMITRADADRNARITRDEMRNAAAALFASLDADHDGLVTPTERASMMPAPPAPPAARMRVPSTAPADPGGMPPGMEPPNGG